MKVKVKVKVKKDQELTERMGQDDGRPGLGGEMSRRKTTASGRCWGSLLPERMQVI